MAGGLPPPPTRAASGDFAWTAWYNQLYTLLSTTGSVSWALIDKAGSSIGDLANKSHALLTAISGTGIFHISQGEATNVTGLSSSPVTKTANFTVGAEGWIICNGTGTITATLPTAATSSGRTITIKTIAAFTVVSAASNVVPLAGGAAGTAILAATAGKYATLVCDGTNWIVMAAN